MKQERVLDIEYSLIRCLVKKFSMAMGSFLLTHLLELYADYVNSQVHTCSTSLSALGC